MDRFNKQKAFTLAEVLITLGIIGVVAAMTLPALINGYQKKQMVTQLKKAYSNLYNAVKLSEVKNGSVDYWNYQLSAKDFYEKYLKDYMALSTKKVSTSNITYKYLNGSNCTEILCTGNSYIVTLSDGSLIIVSNASGGLWSNGKTVSVDINGYKKPNTVGKDLFSYVIRTKYGLSPLGYKEFGSEASENAESNGALNQIFGEYDRAVLTSGRNYACNREKRGFWCSALILMDGWEIKEDYPW